MQHLNILTAFDKFVDKRIEVRVVRARLAQPRYKDHSGIASLLVPASRYMSSILRWHSAQAVVELQFADGDARAVCAQITKSKTRRRLYADEADIFLRQFSGSPSPCRAA